MRGFIYEDGVMTALGTLGGTESTATGINDSGVVCGWSAKSDTIDRHAFRYSEGVMTGLSTLGGDESIGLGINGAGTIVGWSDLVHATNHPFKDVAGTMTDLGYREGPLPTEGPGPSTMTVSLPAGANS